MSIDLEIANGWYQEEGLRFKRNGKNCHFIEDDFIFVITDADSDVKTENLPMIVARVDQDKFKPYE